CSSDLTHSLSPETEAWEKSRTCASFLRHWPHRATLSIPFSQPGLLTIDQKDRHLAPVSHLLLQTHQTLRQLLPGFLPNFLLRFLAISFSPLERFLWSLAPFVFS